MYTVDDLLYTKTKILGINQLECDINNDGITNVLDYLTMKRDIIREAQLASSEN